MLRCSARGAALGFAAVVSVVALAASAAADIAAGRDGAGSLPEKSYGVLSDAGDETSPPIIVTRESTDLPAGCSPSQVAEFIIGFFNDFNRDREPALLRRLAPPSVCSRRVIRNGRSDFRWYTVSPPGLRHFAAYDSETFLRYVRRRHLKREQLRLVMVDVGSAWARSMVNVSFVLIRTADDLPTRDDLGADPLAFGKGAINCAPNTLPVWSMSGPPQTFAWMCPTPSGWSPGMAVVACARDRPDAPG